MLGPHQDSILHTWVVKRFSDQSYFKRLNPIVLLPPGARLNNCHQMTRSVSNPNFRIFQSSTLIPTTKESERERERFKVCTSQRLTCLKSKRKEPEQMHTSTRKLTKATGIQSQKILLREHSF